MLTVNGAAVRKLAIGVIAPIVVLVPILIIGYKVKDWFEDSRPELSKEIVAGIWRGAGGSELTIRGSGTFNAPRIPTTLLDSAPSKAATSGAGRWQLVASPNDSTGRITQVELTFVALDGYRVPFVAYLRSDMVDHKIVLFWFIGDPDLGRRFILQKS